MSIFTGREVNVGFAKESSRGTFVAPTYWVPRISGDIDDQFDIIEHTASYGTIDAVTGSAKSKQWAEGNFTANVGDVSIGLILKALFGTESASAASGETIVYEHTFSPQTSAQHPSLSVTKKDAARTVSFQNAMITSLEISAVADDFVTFTAGIRGKVGASQSATVSYTTERFFTRANVTLKRATTLAGLASGTAVNVKSFKVVYTPNVVDDDILGSADPNDFLNTELRIEGEFELKYEDDTFHDFAKNQTATYYRLYMENTTTIGNAEKPSLQLDFMSVVSKEWSRKDDNNAIVGQTVKIVGKYNTTDALSCRAILTNLVTSAY
jgi:hypothetical protein